MYHFVPVGIETYGAYGPQGIKLVKQIGKKIQDATGEKLSTFYLLQSISMAIQRGNAICVTTCVKDRLLIFTATDLHHSADFIASAVSAI